MLSGDFSPRLIFLLFALACRKPSPHEVEPNDAPSGTISAASQTPSPSTSASIVVLRVASDRRDLGAIPTSFSSSHEVVLRRATARAIAQLADVKAEPRLAQSLSDSDPEVVAWSAYGLALPCE